MIWRAMYFGGGGVPPSPAEPGETTGEDNGEYVPEYTGASKSIMIGGSLTEKAYRVDIKDPLDIGKPVKTIVRSGTARNIVERGLWEEAMWNYGSGGEFRYAVPPLRGSFAQLASEFNPTHQSGSTDPYEWRFASNPVTGVSDAEATAEVFTEYFHAVTRGGTNLWDIIVREIQKRAEAGTLTLNGSFSFNLYFTNASDLPRISVTINMVNQSPFSDGPVIPETFYTGAGGYKFWTPLGASQLESIKSISIGLQPAGPSGLIYNGYGDRYANANAYWEQGVSGFAQYGKPEIYLFLLPNGKITLATNTHNNSNRGVVTSMWPMVGDWSSGFDPSAYGLELLPGIPGDAPKRRIVQYRMPGWAQFVR